VPADSGAVVTLATGTIKRKTSGSRDTKFEKTGALQRLQGMIPLGEGASVSTLVSVGLLVATGSIAAYIPYITDWKREIRRRTDRSMAWACARAPAGQRGRVRRRRHPDQARRSLVELAAPGERVKTWPPSCAAGPDAGRRDLEGPDARHHRELQIRKR
jgi:hypothetical protein